MSSHVEKYWTRDRKPRAEKKYWLCRSDICPKKNVILELLDKSSQDVGLLTIPESCPFCKSELEFF